MQFGLVKKRSIVDAMNEVVNIAKISMAEKRFCCIIILDIDNVFNTAKWDVLRRINKNEISLTISLESMTVT